MVFAFLGVESVSYESRPGAFARGTG